jgi:DNA-binding response OmpR family regulator
MTYNPAETKILVIDDDDVIRLTMQSVLKKKGFQVFTAENGNVGLELFKKETPQIVITDMLMPNKEGLETITEIRMLKTGVKIIAMSGGGSTQNMTFLQLAEKVGADLLLSKPVKPDQLITAIESLLGN